MKNRHVSIIILNIEGGAKCPNAGLPCNSVMPPLLGLNDSKITVKHNSIITLKTCLFKENQAHSQGILPLKID